MKQILLLITFFLTGTAAFAQQGPVYGQYFHNPFLYNPAYAGAEMYPVLTVTHQRQLVGIEGAPVASTLTFHTPLLKKVAVGARIGTDTQGLLSSSSGQLAMVYVLQLSKSTNLRFGLAGGVSKNQLDLGSATEAQLTYLANISRSYNQLDIQFGMVLQGSRAGIGISFPNMTRRSLLVYDSFSSFELEPLEHMVLTGNYKIDLVPTQLLLEPVLIYERFNSTQEQRLEGGALLYIKELVWVGGTYQYKNGFSGLLGIKVQDHVSFGYAYGMSTHTTGFFTHASHELQLKVKLGKLREFKDKQDLHLPRFMSSAF